MVRWGILGAGNIAHRFCKALDQEDNGALVAIAGRSKEKLEAFRSEWPCPSVYTNYQELIDDPNVDAVYIALPNALHFEWAKKALEAHKPVLCEKPAMIDSAQAEKLAAIARKEQTLFMEAMKNRFVPSYVSLIERIEAGEFGEVQTMDLSCGNQAASFLDEHSHFMSPVYGGCLWDLGIYQAGFLNGFFKDLHPVQMHNERSEAGTMLFAQALLQDEKGIPVSLMVSYDRPLDNRAIIICDKAVITIPDLHRPHGYETSWCDGAKEEVTAPYDHDDFYSQIHHFDELVENGQKESPVMSLEDTILCTRLLEEIRDFDLKDDQ